MRVDILAASLVMMLVEPKVIDEAKTEPEIIDEPEFEPEIFDEPEPEPDPEDVDEPESETEVEESLIGTHVDLFAEPTMELLSSSPTVRALLSLRPPDVYNPLHIFLNETGSWEFGVLVYGSVFNRANLSYFTVFILLELPLIATDLSHKLVPPPPRLRHDTSMPLL